MQAPDGTKRDSGWAVLMSADGEQRIGRGHLYVEGDRSVQYASAAISDSDPGATSDWRGVLDPIRLESGLADLAPGKYQLLPETPHQASEARTGEERVTAQELRVEVVEVTALNSDQPEFVATLRSLDGMVPTVVTELGGE